ncbi:MAG: ribose-5-phosphate isomerase RpiA, partial [Nitriliruptoraceae bacterium]
GPPPDLVTDGMVLGLGTGSTVAFFLDELAARGLDVRGIPTSEATAEACRRHGIELVGTADVEQVDLAVDGADELDTALRLVKGGGGALLREKVVAAMAREFVVIATVDKVVDRLGDSFPLPVEVVPFAVAPVTRNIAALGFEVTTRAEGLTPTDNGNAVLFCHLAGGIADLWSTEQELRAIPGVVCTGLFLDMANVALLGDADGGVERLEAHATAE